MIDVVLVAGAIVSSVKNFLKRVFGRAFAPAQRGRAIRDAGSK
jgi:hypothetical protein